MPALALTLYVLYLLVVFVLRGVIQWRRTGDTGFRLDADRPGSRQWWARVGFVLALVLGPAAPILQMVGAIEPIAALDRPSVATVGAIVSVASIAAVFAAQLAMGASWRVGLDPDERTDLVVRWPFTLVRNPIFTTMASASIGLALVAPTWLAIASSALLIASLEYQVRGVEEPYLRDLHGSSYRDYVARVGRFVPGVGKLDLG